MTLLAISPDDEDRLAAFATKAALGYPLLRDPGSQAVRAYGILNEAAGRVPHPTVLVLDADLVISYRSTNEDYRVRPPVGEILAALAGLGGK